MAKHFSLPEDISLDDIEKKIDKAHCKVFIKHLSIIRAIMKKYRTKDIADLFRVSENWIHQLVSRFRTGGLDALKDGRKNNGSESVFSEDELEQAKKNCESYPILMAAFGTQKK